MSLDAVFRHNKIYFISSLHTNVVFIWCIHSTVFLSAVVFAESFHGCLRFSSNFIATQNHKLDSQSVAPHLTHRGPFFSMLSIIDQIMDFNNIQVLHLKTTRFNAMPKCTVRRPCYHWVLNLLEIHIVPLWKQTNTGYLHLEQNTENWSKIQP